MDYLADYHDAQRAGHHPECDGFRTAHRTHIDRNGGLFTARCDECGPLHIGSCGSESTAKRFAAGHASEVRCDGRCRDWN